MDDPARPADPNRDRELTSRIDRLRDQQKHLSANPPRGSDPDALDYVAKVTGIAEFQQRSRTAGETGQRSTTEGTMFRELAPANSVREAREESALLIYHNLPPVRIALRPHFKEKNRGYIQQTSGYSDRR